MSKLSFAKVDRFTTHATKGGKVVAIISIQDGVSVRLIGKADPFYFTSMKGAKAFVSCRALNS